MGFWLGGVLKYEISFHTVRALTTLKFLEGVQVHEK